MFVPLFLGSFAAVHQFGSQKLFPLFLEIAECKKTSLKMYLSKSISGEKNYEIEEEIRNEWGVVNNPSRFEQALVPFTPEIYRHPCPLSRADSLRVDGIYWEWFITLPIWTHPYLSPVTGPIFLGDRHFCPFFLAHVLDVGISKFVQTPTPKSLKFRVIENLAEGELARPAAEIEPGMKFHLSHYLWDNLPTIMIDMYGHLLQFYRLKQQFWERYASTMNQPWSGQIDCVENQLRFSHPPQIRASIERARAIYYNTHNTADEIWE